MEEKKLKFEELELSENVKKALADMGYVSATPIQEKTIPIIMSGKDIIGQSQTGTGKTAAYCLPIIEKINKDETKVQAIILCPTRELAVQITEEFRRFTKYEDNIKCLAVYGGEQITKQIIALRRGIQIVIGTPGRVMDHMRRKTLKLDNVKMVVLDEADEMLNMGFEEDMKTILSEIPEERQTLLFSATMNKKILAITKKYLKEPENIIIKSKELTVDKIEQYSIELKSPMKDNTVMRLIDVNNPKKAVVFCNTKRKVDSLIEQLKLNGYKAESLHGDVKQEQRQRIMNRLKKGEFKVLVATDVVARGIDVDELELVINYDIPQEEEYYVHRIGRTGRNGNFGKAYTFVVGKEKDKLASIEKYANTKITIGKMPTIDQINEIKSKQVAKNIQNMIDDCKFENKKCNDEILDSLLKQNDIETVARALLEMVNAKNMEKQNNKDEKEFVREIPKGMNGVVKLFINVGKKDKIMAKDIVGSMSANAAITGSEIGKINILDSYSFVEVPGYAANDVLSGMQGKQIKGRSFNIEMASNNEDLHYSRRAK